MRILHLLYESRDDVFGIGGVGMRAYEIYRLLRSAHDITLLCKKYPGAVNGNREDIPHLFVGRESRSFTATLLSYACQARQFVKRYGNNYDVIVEEFSPAIPTFLQGVTRRPIVLQIQGFTGALYFRKYNPLSAAALYAMERLRPGRYSNFIFMNEETVKRFSLGSCIRREIIPNGISPELLNLSPEEGDYILYLGRIDVYGKGLDTLLNGYARFHSAFPAIKLVIAGDGRDKKRFLRELEGMAPEARKGIEMPGWVSGEQKAELMRKALLAVFPSRHEVQPITALEAMACGKALIVSDIPEFAFVTAGDAGISFRTGDAGSLAEAMKRLVMSPQGRAMGQKGRDAVRSRTWENVALRYESFLHKVAAQGREGGHGDC